ncbi:MAG: ankyrin repeat domain-containing protein [Planctomycetes bacterium]|nr:ankyrin repeat domain-containing protein [Planctomycetota bacterium]
MDIGKPLPADERDVRRCCWWAVTGIALVLAVILLASWARTYWTASLNARDADGMTPLYRASWFADKARVEELLSSGAKVNGTTCEQQAALHAAASIGNMEIAELLLAHGAILDARDSGDRTPLHEAAGQGHKRCVELLGSKLIISP